MNEKLSEEIINSFNKKSFIDEWLSYKYKEKSIAIYVLDLLYNIQYNIQYSYSYSYER